MSECKDIRRLLALRPDDRSTAEQKRVEAHLDTCAECAALAETYAEQDRVLRAKPWVGLTPSQRGQLLSTIHRERRRYEMRNKLSAVLGAAAGVAILIALAFGLKVLLPRSGRVAPGGISPGGRSESSSPPKGSTARLGGVDFAVVEHERTGCVTLGSGEERCPPEGQAYLWVKSYVENSERYPTTDNGPRITVVHQGQELPEMLFLPEGKSSRSACTPDGYYRDEPCHFWVGAVVPTSVDDADLAVQARWGETTATWPLGAEEEVRVVSDDGAAANGDVERELARQFVDDPDGECGWEVLGEGDMQSYVWAICQSPGGTAVSAPAVVHWEAGRETVMKIQMPRDGSFHKEDVRLLFPPAVQERILDHDVDMDAIWRQIERDLTTVTGTVVDNAASAEVVTLEDDDGKQWHVLWRAGDAVRRSDGSRAEFRDLERGMTVEVVGFPRPEATTPNVLAPARVTILSEPEDLAASLKGLLLQHDELPEFARQSISRDEWTASMLPVVNQGTEDWTVDLATTDSCLGAFQVEAPLTVKQEDGSFGTVYLLNAVYQYETPDQAMQHYQNLLTRETSVPRETLYDGKTESGMQALAMAFTGLDGDALYWLFGVQEQHLHLLIVNGLDDDATRAFFQATMSQVLAR